MRPPRSGDWHGVVDGQITQGQTRVIVNLDTLEYINPVKFGQPPTLAGMVRQAPKNRCLPILKKAAKDNHYLVDVAGGLFAMLCHPKRRGGGDLPANAEELADALGAQDSRMKKSARLYAGDEELYGDSDLHIAKVVVDDEAELENGRGFSPDGQALSRDDPKAVAAMELIEADKSAEWPAWEFGW